MDSPPRKISAYKKIIGWCEKQDQGTILRSCTFLIPFLLGRCIKELERIYGVEYGGNRKTRPNVSDLKSQSDIAEMIGISVDTLQNYKKLTELVPELVGLRIKESKTIYGVHNGNQLSNNCKADIKQKDLADKL